MDVTPTPETTTAQFGRSMPCPYEEVVRLSDYRKLEQERDDYRTEYEMEHAYRKTVEQELDAALSTVAMRSGQIMQLRDDRDAWKAKAERTCMWRRASSMTHVASCGHVYALSFTAPKFCENCGGCIVKEGQ